MPNTITSPVFVCRDNIDTDQIIPAQYLTLVPTIAEEYEKLGSYAMIGLPDDLYPQKFVPEGGLKTEYKIVIAGRNFGCGSSREHAPWALLDFGVRCVISTSFADIFYNNCFKNGILPLVVSPEQLKLLMDDAERGANATISVDLENQTIKGPDGGTIHFDIDPARRQTLLEGLDDIAATMKEGAEIAAFETKVATSRPWI